jgi:polyhydroxybutyrate depolymerase
VADDTDGSLPLPAQEVRAVGPVVPSPGCGTADAEGVGPGATDRVTTLARDHLEREVVQTVPSAHDGVTPVPLVLNLHGLMSDGTFQRSYAQMDRPAEQAGVVVLYPMGTPEGQTSAWQVGTEGATASVPYVDALIDDAGERLCLDLDRVYATGMSNGGLMASRLACDLSDRIAAVATVAGTFLPPDCEPTRAVPWMAVHGTDDDVLEYDGGVGPRLEPSFIDVTRDGGSQLGALPDTMAELAQRAACATGPEQTDLAEHVTATTWSGCERSGEVVLVTVAGGSHSWPGGMVDPAHPDAPGAPTQEISASELALEFFARHSLEQP